MNKERVSVKRQFLSFRKVSKASKSTYLSSLVLTCEQPTYFRSITTLMWSCEKRSNKNYLQQLRINKAFPPETAWAQAKDRAALYLWMTKRRWVVY